MASGTFLPLVALFCLFGCVLSQNNTCNEIPTGAPCGDGSTCPGSPADVDEDGNCRDECCKYFVRGCCSEAENKDYDLYKNLAIAGGVALLAIIIIVLVVSICCCVCFCF